jgi:hypothetical protein
VIDDFGDDSVWRDLAVQRDAERRIVELSPVQIEDAELKANADCDDRGILATSFMGLTTLSGRSARPLCRDSDGPDYRKVPFCELFKRSGAQREQVNRGGGHGGQD